MATVTAESLGLSNLTPDQMAAAQQPAMGYNTQAALTPIYSGQSSYFGTPQITGYSGADGTQYNAQGQVTGAASLNGQVYSFDPSTGAVTYQEKADGGGLGATLKNVASSPVIQIAAAVALPGIGEALAPSIMALTSTAEGVATISEALATQIGSAAASVAVQTASGVPLEKAIENAGVNLLVQTQSQPAVQALNKAIGSPAIASAITSATGSAITAAAQGKSGDQILRAAEGGAVGGATGAALGTTGDTGIPGVTTPSVIQDALNVTPTQASNLGTALASTLGTALGTGSTQATLASLAGQLGSGNLNSILSTETPAGGTVSDEKASASPYTRTGAIGSQPVVPTDADTITTGTTTPTGVSNVANVNVTGGGDTVPTAATTTTPASTGTSPNVTITAPTDSNVSTANTTSQLINQIGLGNVAATTTPAQNVTITGSTDNNAVTANTTSQLLNQIGLSNAAATSTQPQNVTVTGTRDSNVAVANTTPVITTTTPTNTTPTDYGNVTVTGEKIIPTDEGNVTVTGQKIIPTDYGNVDVVGQKIIPTDQGNVTVTDTKIPTVNVGDTLLPPADDKKIKKTDDTTTDPYIPVSITGGPAIKTKPTVKPIAISAIPQLKTGQTEGLTSGGEGGEIESQETGGPRQSVWNESSLRLRDALGLG